MIIVALVAIIIAIFAAGAVLPKQHVAISSAMIRTNSPDFVWNALINHAEDPQWRDDLQKVERMPDRNGHQVWLETYKNGMKLELEDIFADPPKKLVREVRDTGNMFSGRWEIEVTKETPIYCKATITEYGEVPNPFFRFMSRFVFGHTKSMEQYLQSLRRHVDGTGYPDY